MSTHSLRHFIERHERVFLLTGAGCSTDSGIPDYRDARGEWKRLPPVTLQAFMGEDATRRRYWARSMLGWPRFGHAVPNTTHHALAALERSGRVALLLTQNVDCLHQRAGSRHVIDLHGRLDVVRCMGCEQRSPREALQRELERLNPQWLGIDAAPAPDGDVDLDDAFTDFVIPACAQCAGVLKPDVVFFGENVPRERVDTAMEALSRADAMLVVGSSLMVYSGFRFARAAAQRGIPIAALNRGRTRADELLTLKCDGACAASLAWLLDQHGIAAAAAD